MAIRRLSHDELLVLRLVQAHFGPQNTMMDVFLTSSAEACIAARDAAGAARALVNLTSLGAWYRTGRMSMDELRAWIAGDGAPMPPEHEEQSG
jgi:hypothetical protein